jgi:cytochrome P450
MMHRASSFPRRIFERLFSLVFARRVRAFAGVPGPAPVFPFGNALELVKGDLHKLFETYRETYGDYVVFWVLGQPSLLVNEPDLIARILVDGEGDYHKNVPRAATKPTMGSSVFRSEGGPDWAAKRADHPLQARGIDAWYEQVVPLVRRVVQDHLDRLVPAERATHADFFDELYRLSFQVFATTVLGRPLSWNDFDDHARLLAEIGARGNMPVAFSWSPVFWYRRRRWLRMIEQRLHEHAPDAAAQAPSLVAYYRQAHGGGGSPLGERHLRDEVSNVFSAGMKNVAIAVAAVLFLLSRHADVRAKLQAEIDAAFPPGGPGLGLAALSAEAMPYLDRVVKESLRVYPVVPGFVREVKPGRAATLGGRTLPDTTQIFITAWTMHHHPALWEDPLRFDPDRFLTDPPPHRYLPFGMGARSCVGERFTLLCVKTMLTEILRAYTVDVDPACTFDTTLMAGTIPPRDGMPARISERAR